MLKPATQELLDRIENEAAALKNKVLTSKTEIVTAEGADSYYVSPNGNDDADGLSPQTAWKTLANVNSVPMKMGSVVYFERGGLWRGQVLTQTGVTYTAYGEGAKPTFYGCVYDGAKDGEWLETDVPNVYKYSIRFGVDIGEIVFDDGAQNAYKVICRFKDGQPVYDGTFKQEFTSWRDLKNDLAFFHDLGGPCIGIKTVNGFAEPTQADIIIDAEYDITSPVIKDENVGYLYLYSEAGNPRSRFSKIEFGPRMNLFQVGDKTDIRIDNVCIKYCGAHGVGAITTKNLYITNCEIGWIGGGLQGYYKNSPIRYGNGVEIYGGCDDYEISNCYVYQCYDAGITHQYSDGGTDDIIMKNVRYIGNLIEDCVYSIEYFLGVGETEDVVRYMENVLFEGNILRFAGRGWGTQRPDGKKYAHVKAWNHPNPCRPPFIIKNNIMQVSEYDMLHSGYENDSDAYDCFDNLFIQKEGARFTRMGNKASTELNYTEEDMSTYIFPNNEFYKI